MRVRAYLHRKAGRAGEARVAYWRAGAREWQGSIEQEWEDMVRQALIVGPVTGGYV